MRLSNVSEDDTTVVESLQKGIRGYLVHATTGQRLEIILERMGARLLQSKNEGESCQ